jgi:hypothetical protein
MNSYSYDSTFAFGNDSFTSGPLAFNNNAFTYNVAGPSSSLHQELMDKEERFLEKHDDCEDMELVSHAWLYRNYVTDRDPTSHLNRPCPKRTPLKSLGLPRLGLASVGK